MPVAAIGVEDGEELKSGQENRDRKTSQRIPMNRYRARPPPTTREQYTMAKQPQQPQRMQSTKSARRRRNPTDDIEASKQHRQPHMLTRAAGGRNPKEASNDNLTAAPLPANRVEGTGRWTQAERKRTEEQAAAVT